MLNLLRMVTSWTARKVLIFLAVLVAAMAWYFVDAAFEERSKLTTELASLQAEQTRLEAEVAEEAAKARMRAQRAGSSTRPQLVRRLAEVRQDKTKLIDERAPRLGYAFVMLKGPGAISADMKESFHLVLLRREEVLLQQAIELVDKKVAARRFNVRRIEARIADLERRIAQIEANHPTLTQFESVPVVEDFVGPWKQLQAARQELGRRKNQLRQLEAANAAARSAADGFERSYTNLLQTVPPTYLLQRQVQARQAELSKSGLSLVMDALQKVLLRVVGICAVLFLAPPLIKAFWYYMLAPIAGRLDPIRIRPDLGAAVCWGDSSGNANASPGSAVSRQVRLTPAHELLVKPEFLQSSMNDAHIDSQAVLNRKLFFGSFAIGLTGLTRVRVKQEAFATISATTDLIDEVAVIEIAEGSGMVFHPRNLIGVVQPIERPIKISKVWRLGHLSSWLTFQFRFLVFHGPCSLLVKGARGVALEPAEYGRRISGAATMGWTPGSDYSVRRSETFFAYLTGKQSLFNDSFDGNGGKIIYEQMPRAGARSGFFGRGLEGLGDGLLKVVGL